METAMHKHRDFSAAFEPAKCNRFRTLYSAVREWSIARTARKQQADALLALTLTFLRTLASAKPCSWTAKLACLFTQTRLGGKRTTMRLIADERQLQPS